MALLRNLSFIVLCLVLPQLHCQKMGKIIEICPIILILILLIQEMLLRNNNKLVLNLCCKNVLKSYLFDKKQKEPFSRASGFTTKKKIDFSSGLHSISKLKLYCQTCSTCLHFRPSISVPKSLSQVVLIFFKLTKIWLWF